MEEINELLVKLWGSMITLCDIDIKSHTIDFQFVTYHVDQSTTTTHVRLIGTESLCFGAELASQDMLTQRMECVSIEARSSDVATLKASFHSNGREDYMVHPNIVMEIDSSFFTVRANSIVIDEKVYSLT